MTPRAIPKKVVGAIALMEFNAHIAAGAGHRQYEQIPGFDEKMGDCRDAILTLLSLAAKDQKLVKAWLSKNPYPKSIVQALTD